MLNVQTSALYKTHRIALYSLSLSFLYVVIMLLFLIRWTQRYW